ncbi:MAG: protoporphyrinogen oxidase, partial [Candidatus Eisenbacteria bacterium]|nr:protoporphyrinogen oxidase [Candidatus Eisenbacteria bacterium]
ETAGVLTSFRDGMETLIERLGERLGADRVRLGRPVASISRVEGSGAFVLATQDGESFEAERVVIAVPAGAAARILRPLDEPMATDLAGIASAPLAVAAFAWPVSDLASVPDGFGFLVPRGQGLRILGCLWDSSVFSHRAPEGWVLVRAMLGGAHDPQAASLPDEEIVAIVRDELRKSMGIEAPPRRVHLFRHPLGIPQYEIGHGARLERIAGRLARLDPGGGRRLGLLGNAYRGVAVNQCVKDATDLAANWISGDGAWRREPIAGERPASAPHDPNG